MVSEEVVLFRMDMFFSFLERWRKVFGSKYLVGWHDFRPHEKEEFVVQFS